MSIEATQVDPRLTFNYSIEVEGLEIALCQKANIPDVDIESVEHSGPGAAWSTKTGGKLTFGDITLEKVMRVDVSDRWAWTWLKTVRNPVDGSGNVSSVYKKNLTIIHYGPSKEILDRWVCEGNWPKSIKYSAGDTSQKAEKTMETVVLSCDKYDRP